MSWTVEKFSRTKNDKWHLIDKNNMSLKLHFDQLFLLSNSSIVESFKLKHFIKGFLKERLLILLYQDEDKFNKVKFMLSCEEHEVEKLIQILGIYFTIHTTRGAEGNTTVKNFQQVIKAEMHRQITATNIGNIFPEGFPLDQFIKTCLLDPDFPKLADGIQNIINRNTS